MRRLLLASATGLALCYSCSIQPPLHLPEKGTDIEAYLPLVNLDIDILWDYELKVDEITGEIISGGYEWRDQFHYGWDDLDDELFGNWDMVVPTVFNVRRYHTGDDPSGLHTAPEADQVEGNHISAHFHFGYYDILLWNEVKTIDGVQSLHFDESSTYEYVTAYTNKSMNRAHYVAKQPYSYYQPEFLFGGYYEDLHISNDPADYDFYDEERQAYVKHISLVQRPRTYIYVTQIILHNNRGRIANIDGSANMQGMASSTNLNTGVTGSEEISVHYGQRLKQNVDMKGESVDIVGGRLFTFGLCNLNPSEATRASASDNTSRNYIDVDMIFNNGLDSTFVFDVTDQIHDRYKGGIITIELDVDTIPIPSRAGGSGFDAVVQDFDSLNYEFDM